MNENIEIHSPFKFLDSYTKDDMDIFFGRHAEIEELYERVFESKLIILYGASGTGKTSLINCGLANQFDDRDWLPVAIRRHDHLVDTLHTELAKVADTPFPSNLPLIKKIRSIYLDYYKPVYLIFDQFEEIFILGTEKEQAHFFESVKEVLHSDLQCKILIVIRGEYLDKISKYELIIPSLFNNRLYLERMSRSNLHEVIKQTSIYYDIELLDEDRTINQIIDNITPPKGGVELANLQIYLDKLYRNDVKRRGDAQRPIRFDNDLLKRTRQLEDVLSDFLEEQLQILEDELSEKGVNQKGIPMDILFALVTEDGTKQTLLTNLIKKSLERRKGVSPDIIDYCLQRFSKMKIVRLMEDDS